MKTAPLFEKFVRAIKWHRLLDVGDRVIVAVSGGADSVALLHLLLGVQKRYQLDLVVAHVNHNLRGEESEGDEAFVRELACQWQLDFISGKVPTEEVLTRRGNLESWARDRRYEFLSECAASRSAQRIALGHTLSDQAETVLMRLVHGSGTRGLAAIPPKRDRFIRPLLYLERAEIRDYLNQHGLKWREDSSNADIGLLRNRLRHSLIPHLREAYNPRIASVLSNTAEILSEEAEALDFCLASLFNQEASFDGERVIWEVPRLRVYPTGLQRNLIRHSLLQLGARRDRGSSKVIVALLDLLREGQSGRCFQKGAIRCTRVFQRLIIERVNPGSNESQYRYVLGVPSQVILAHTGTEFVASMESFPATAATLNRWELFLTGSEIKEGFVIRNAQPGDSYLPPGSRSHAKVSELLARRKIPRDQRLLWPVITQSDRIICVKDFPLPSDRHLQKKEGEIRVVLEERIRRNGTTSSLV